MKTLYIIDFSPTGTSFKAAEQIGAFFEGEKIRIDLCEEPKKEIPIGEEALCIFSMPCYGGRIPLTAARRLSCIRGANTAAILCITFGNRAFEDALLELSNCVTDRGFQVVAGCGISAEHNIMHIFGQGRPDKADLEELKQFAAQVQSKLQKGDRSRPEFPGSHPYKERHGGSLPIWTEEKTCVNCGICARKCPVNAISADGRTTDRKTCIGCMRCVKLCPNQSRHVSLDYLDALIERLRPACEGRKENQFFL